jgi:Ran GTPase-activating protein 1
MATTSTKVFSLEGQALKLDTAADVEQHIKSLREMDDVVEVRLQGNTLGIEACKVLGEVLETKKTLQVRLDRRYLPKYPSLRVSFMH